MKTYLSDINSEVDPIEEKTSLDDFINQNDVDLDVTCNIDDPNCENCGS